MCGTATPLIVLNRREAQALKAQGFPEELLIVSPDLREGGHVPATADNRFPRMGGRPSKGTKKDGRLRENKKGKKRK